MKTNPLGSGLIKFDLCLWKIILSTLFRVDWWKAKMEADSCSSLDEEWDNKNWTNLRHNLAVGLTELGDGLDAGREKKGVVKWLPGLHLYNWANGSATY